MQSFYTCGTTFSHIVTPIHFRGLQHHSDIFNTFTFTHSEMSCTQVHHLWIFYHVSMHHTSAHLWIFDSIYTGAMCCQNLPISADTHLFISHHIPGTLYCISEHLPAWKHTYAKYPVLSMNGMQNICMIHISQYFYCAKTGTCTFSSLHSSPSIWHLSSVH